MRGGVVNLGLENAEVLLRRENKGDDEVQDLVVANMIHWFWFVC